MAPKQKDPSRVLLKDVRIGYPNVFKPRGFGRGDGGDKAYSAQFYIDTSTKEGKANIALCEDAIEEAMFKEFGEDRKKWPKIKKANMACFYGDDVDEDERKPEWEGMFVVRSRNKKRPLVLDRDKTELVEEDNRPYGGCYVDAIVRFWAQTYEGIPRINCSLEAVRFRRDGEPFGHAPVDPDEFEDLDDVDEDDRSSRRRSGDDDERDHHRRRDDDEDEGRGSRRQRSSDDDEGSPRRRRDEDDDDEDRPPRNSRARRSSDYDDDV